MVGSLIAGDRAYPEALREGKEDGMKYSPIKDAIKIPLPDVEQPDDYSCGPSALMSICWHFGVGPQDLAHFKKKLDTDSEEGTHFKNIVRYARKLGLEVKAVANMTCAQLEQYVGEGKPVICSMQAYADRPKDYDDPNNNDNGQHRNHHHHLRTHRHHHVLDHEYRTGRERVLLMEMRVRQRKMRNNNNNSNNNNHELRARMGRTTATATECAHNAAVMSRAFWRRTSGG